MRNIVIEKSAKALEEWGESGLHEVKDPANSSELMMTSK